MKRTATVDQRRSNAAYSQSNPLLPVNRSKQRQRAFDAATEYFKKYKTPLTDTLQTLFGTEFFARAALWLDPLAPFRNAAGIIGYENRFREQPNALTHNGHVVSTELSRESRNYIADYPDPVREYTISESENPQFDYLNDDLTRYSSYMWDSTRKSRSWEDSWASGERYDRAIPSFGTMHFLKAKSEDYLTPNIVVSGYDEYQFILADGVVTPLYDRQTFTNRVLIDGSCTSVSGPLFVDDIENVALDFMNDNVSSVLVNALASRRSFNLAYQISELKDLPRLIGDIGNLQRLVESYVKNPVKKLTELDKDIASLNLSWEFGVKSFAGALKGLLNLPERATKRLNYLIQRNNKVSTGRSNRKWLNYELDGTLPTFEFHLPDWIVPQDQHVERRIDIELRCVVNQTIQFPSLAVPSLSNKDYLRLIGLTPTPKDVYDIIPFSWLLDWFGGLGDYIDVMSSIHSDTQLINYGFLTIVVNESLTHTAGLKVTSEKYSFATGSDSHGDPATIDIEHTFSSKVIPYKKVYTRKYQQRVDIGSLEGVKSFGWFQTNLSDFQAKILGSLTSQRL
jgi:hypothetical protein